MKVFNGTLRRERRRVMMIELMSKNRPVLSLSLFLIDSLETMLLVVVDDQTSTVESNQAHPSLTWARCLADLSV
jgi:hypothetical protein